MVESLGHCLSHTCISMYTMFMRTHDKTSIISVFFLTVFPKHVAPHRLFYIAITLRAICLTDRQGIATFDF